MAWEERGSYLNIFWTTNRGRFSETITNYEANHLLRNKSVRIVFANRSGFEAPIGVFMGWEERGSYLNILWTKNRGRISETITNYEANHLLRKGMDHVLTFSGQQFAVESQKPSRITMQNTCCAVAMAWEERGSCRNIFQTTNLGRISETFTNYDAKHLLRK
ncbi:uncharacterized protein G2W53_010290 [Senna tora]|uniref:Uncharacterized protein n=1 Tax=Senna tora TaxID=362788 RepID=A0A834WZL8_9FABA|nr:uncharacterized protein G2W53_010290 [Senna tora]